MADKPLTRDLSEDDDIDIDAEVGIAHKPLTLGSEPEFSVCKRAGEAVKFPNRLGSYSDPWSHSGNKKDSSVDTQAAFRSKIELRNRKTSEDSCIDSGILSLGSNIESIPVEDKFAVQCSDSTENDEVLRKFEELGIQSRSTDDEGFDECSSSEKETVSGLLNDNKTDDDKIEIDLFQQDEDGDTIIHVAICNLCQDVCVTLIGLADTIDCLNIQNNLLQSPLHLAVLTGQIDIVKALVVKGVDVTLRDHQGNTPLHIACRKGDKDSVALLVQSFGRDKARRVKYFSTKNYEGLSCLHEAAQERQYIILGHLFAKGADVNIGDNKSGRTMLHYAVERKDIETVSLLLTHPKINVDCKTFKGETPIVMAYWRNYQDIVKKLKSKGAFFSYDMMEESDEESYT